MYEEKDADQKKEGYLSAINNLQILLANCKTWDFDRNNEYTLEIQRYRKLIKELDDGNK